MTKFKSKQIISAFNHIYSFESSFTQSFIIFSYQYKNVYSLDQSKVISSKFIKSFERQIKQNAENAQRLQNAQNLLYLQQSQQLQSQQQMHFQQVQQLIQFSNRCSLSKLCNLLTSSQLQQAASLLQQQFFHSISIQSQQSIEIAIFEVILLFSIRNADQEVLNVIIKLNANIRFLHEMKSVEKAFKIEKIIIRENDEKAKLEKIICMSDQKSEINVIFELLQ